MPGSPTPRLLFSLAATLLVVALFSWSSLRELQGLRRLQTDVVDRNRRDSLQLIRIQNNLNLLGLSLRDMLDDRDSYGLLAWRSELRRIETDLRDAVRIQSTLSAQAGQQRTLLGNALDQFWRTVHTTFNIAQNGDLERARRMVTDTLQAQQQSLTTLVARQLVENNEAETQAAREVKAIYDAAERHVWWFFVAMLAGTAGIGIATAHHNRRLFNSIAALSEQRSTLARGLIGVQEEVFRSVSRELHDDFGQILTAIGTMLKRTANKHVPADSPLQKDLEELRDIVQESLEKTRSFSQALHPTILDDYGLVRAMERHIENFTRQTGVAVAFHSEGRPALDDGRSIHIYRVLQEALTNVAKHAHATAAEVRLRSDNDVLRLEVEDNGQGPSTQLRQGLGLIAMRERAQLLGGKFRMGGGRDCGTVVVLEVPLKR
ncbi:MAG TPA: sensor histidine kinase [Bryobacteraceae bacterium]|nr:sensor histidine kinase [Bryobacteraceae bacterium]